MRYLLGGLGLLLLAVTLASSVTQIQPGERAVVRRFGRILDDQPGPGLHFFLPFGLDRVERVKLNEVREVTVGEPLADSTDATPSGQLLTGDHNLINLQVKLYYRVPGEGMEKFVLHKERVETLLVRAAESALAEWIAGRTVEEVLLEGKRHIPAWLAQAVAERIAVYDLGVQIGPLPPSVTDLSPPREVKADFDKVTQATTEVKTRLNQAGQFKSERESQAAIEVNNQESHANIYQNNKRLEAVAGWKSFENDMRLAGQEPGYRRVRWWNALARIYAKLEEKGRVEPLDQYLTPDGLNITHAPFAPPRK